MKRNVIKLSAPAAKEFWEIPVVFEDEHLLALNKPPRLLTPRPTGYDPERPNLMKLLHEDVERGAPWAKQRNISYLSNAHRLDFDTSGVILLARSKPVLVELANLFRSEKLVKTYVALGARDPAQGQVQHRCEVGAASDQAGHHSRGRRSRGRERGRCSKCGSGLSFRRWSSVVR